MRLLLWILRLRDALRLRYRYRGLTWKGARERAKELRP